MTTPSEYGVCPLMGKECVGPENCAPAKLLANHQYVIDKAANPQAVRPPAFCPIASCVSAVATTCTLVTPLLLGTFEEEEEPAQPHEPTERERALGKLKIDQH